MEAWIKAPTREGWAYDENVWVYLEGLATN